MKRESAAELSAIEARINENFWRCRIALQDFRRELFLGGERILLKFIKKKAQPVGTPCMHNTHASWYILAAQCGAAASCSFLI